MSDDGSQQIYNGTCMGQKIVISIIKIEKNAYKRMKLDISLSHVPQIKSKLLNN